MPSSLGSQVVCNSSPKPETSTAEKTLPNTDGVPTTDTSALNEDSQYISIDLSQAPGDLTEGEKSAIA